MNRRTIEECLYADSSVERESAWPSLSSRKCERCRGEREGCCREGKLREPRALYRSNRCCCVAEVSQHLARAFRETQQQHEKWAEASAGVPERERQGNSLRDIVSRGRRELFVWT